MPFGPWGRAVIGVIGATHARNAPACSLLWARPTLTNGYLPVFFILFFFQKSSRFETFQILKKNHIWQIFGLQKNWKLFKFENFPKLKIANFFYKMFKFDKCSIWKSLTLKFVWIQKMFKRKKIYKLKMFRIFNQKKTDRTKEKPHKKTRKSNQKVLEKSSRKVLKPNTIYTWPRPAALARCGRQYAPRRGDK
jgi:hypothetical protein